jgi:hypothetical protein
MQTQDRPRLAPRPGLFRRLLLGSGDGALVPDPPPRSRRRRPRTGPVVDLTRMPAGEAEVASSRIARLEQGMRLMAGTMKRALVELSEEIDRVRMDAAVRVPGEDLAAAVARAVDPLARHVEDLSVAVGRVPYILAAAADDLTDRINDLRAEVEGSSRSDQSLAGPPAPPGVPEEATGSLAAVPFELEPVEVGFA